MERIPVIMINRDLSHLPRFNLPEGFFVRAFTHEDDAVWAKVESAAGEFKTTGEALRHFHEEFGNHLQELRHRCIFVCNQKGKDIGTATAWYNNDFEGQCYGRLHWVALIPEYQGKKLAKPLVSLAMDRLKAHHERTYLTTQTTNYKAVSVYLAFGFIPYLYNDTSRRAWSILADRLRHKKLDHLRTAAEG